MQTHHHHHHHQQARPDHQNNLEQGRKLRKDSFLWSKNGVFFLITQEDGNLVLYKANSPFHHPNSHPLWTTNTSGQGNGKYKLRMQKDGNLVLYSKKTPLWSSNTNGKGTQPYRAVVQDDGNLVLYDSHNTALWASNTQQPGFHHVEPHYQAHRDHLNNEQELHNDERLWSNNGLFYLSAQGDGNVVLYRASTAFQSENSHPIWASNTHSQGNRKYKFKIQSDGNLVLLSNKQALWATGTNGKGSGPYHFRVQDDGNAVIYDSHNQATWATNTQYKDVIGNNEEIRTDQKLWAKNGHYYFSAQGDGNAVLYKASKPFQTQNQQPIWASNTHGRGNGQYRFSMQNDGNLVLYSNNEALWASNTGGRGSAPYHFRVQEDGNAVIYDQHIQPIWATNTQGR